MSIIRSISGPNAKPISVSAKAIVLCGDHVLLLKQPNGHWDLPGGKVKKGENVKSGLRREVREETGLEVLPTELIRSSLTSRTKGRERLVLSFLCRLRDDSTNVRLSREHTGFARIPISEALRLDLKPHHWNAVAAAHSHLGNFVPSAP